jgi:hypothetical protein
MKTTPTLLLAALFVSACDPGRMGAPDDAQQQTPADLSAFAPPDMTQQAQPDLRTPPDLHNPLVEPDMTVLADMTVPADLTATPPPNAVCTGAIPVMHGSVVSGNTTGATQSLHMLCRSGARGGVIYYSVALQPFEKVTVTASPASMVDAVVRLLDGCAATSCLTFADETLEGLNETAGYSNLSPSAKTIIIAVSSYNDFAPGAIGLDVKVEQLPPNASCTAATVVAHGTQLANQNAALAIDSATGACRSAAAGKVLYYSATVPPAQQLRATVQATTAWDPVIRVLPACKATTCLADADGSSGQNESIFWQNNKPNAQTVLLAVGSASGTTTGMFNLAVEVATAESCATAQVVSALPATLTGQDVIAGSPGPSCRGTGFNRYYKVNVPANSVLRAVMTPTSSSFDAAVRLLESNCPNSCITSVDSGNPETLVWLNTGATRDVVVAMGPYSLTSGVFDATFSVSAAPTNTTCAAATRVTAPAMLTGQDATAGAAAPCTGSGPNLFYALNVPANNTLRVVMTPAPSFDAAIRLIDGACPTSACITSVDSGNPETLVWKNTGATRDVVVALGRWGTGTPASFDATFELIAPPPNADCSGAVRVTNGTQLANQSLTNAAVALNMSCGANARGKVLFYAVTVEPNQTLEVTATPASNWDPVVRLIDSCTPTSCVGFADNFALGAAETLTYQNLSAAAQELLIAVGSYDENVTGSFGLKVQIN